MFGAGRALLLQLAHPAVARGVADHSDFKRNPFRRLQGTLEAMVAIVYGSEDVAAGVGERVRFIHDHVVGPGYRANDVDNLLWVHATLVDTVFVSHAAFVGPLERREREEYYADMCRVAEVFGVPRQAQPPGVDAFDDYMSSTVQRLEVSPTGRDLGRYIVRPHLPWRLHRPLRPALALHGVFTTGLTPAPLREQFGLRWDRVDQRRFERSRRLAEAAMRVAPPAVRTAPTRASSRIQVGMAGRHNAAFRRQRVERRAGVAR